MEVTGLESEELLPASPTLLPLSYLRASMSEGCRSVSSVPMPSCPVELSPNPQTSQDLVSTSEKWYPHASCRTPLPDTGSVQGLWVR